jgi:NAD(P)-dependent dehydrogenase (short-subunit alcohol dehydrogenase family)
VVRLFEKTDAELGGPTAPVNNAGTVGPLGRVEDLDGAALKAVFELNVIGCFACAREAIRRMSTRHGGHRGGIGNVSSIAARLGSANMWIHPPVQQATAMTDRGAIENAPVGAPPQGQAAPADGPRRPASKPPRRNGC